jgi:hypothetical protein
MDNQNELRSWKRVTKILCTFIKKNEVDVSTASEQISNLITEFTRINSLKEIDEIVELYHKLNNHQDSIIKLECGACHCIECYFHFICNKNLDPNNLFCSCNKQINPKYKNKINQNYTRIQNLKEKCVNCQRIKDKMNFAVLSLHHCQICTDCILNDFKFEKGFKNSCSICNSEYDDECELILRNLKEINISEEEKLVFYMDKCFECDQKKDSRHFAEICQHRHLACKECIQLKRTQNINVCKCGQPISIAN